LRQHFNSNAWCGRRAYESQFAIAPFAAACQPKQMRCQACTVALTSFGVRGYRCFYAHILQPSCGQPRKARLTAQLIRGTRQGGRVRPCATQPVRQFAAVPRCRGASVRAGAATNLAAWLRYCVAVASGALLRADSVSNLVAGLVLPSVAFLVQSGNVIKTGNAA
jgi:hypothetical protein